MIVIIGGVLMGFFGVEPFKSHQLFDARLSMVAACLGSLIIGWQLYKEFNNHK